MNVGQLIEKLQQLNPESLVYLQEDDEGNGYRQVCGADGNAIITCEGREYRSYDADWEAVEAGLGEGEWEELKALPRDVVLY